MRNSFSDRSNPIVEFSGPLADRSLGPFGAATEDVERPTNLQDFSARTIQSVARLARMTITVEEARRYLDESISDDVKLHPMRRQLAEHLAIDHFVGSVLLMRASQTHEPRVMRANMDLARQFNAEYRRLVLCLGGANVPPSTSSVAAPKVGQISCETNPSDSNENTNTNTNTKPTPRRRGKSKSGQASRTDATGARAPARKRARPQAVAVRDRTEDGCR